MRNREGQVKPYRCSFRDCLKRYNHLENLRLHEKTHNFEPEEEIEIDLNTGHLSDQDVLNNIKNLKRKRPIKVEEKVKFVKLNPFIFIEKNY